MTVSNKMMNAGKKGSKYLSNTAKNIFKDKESLLNMVLMAGILVLLVLIAKKLMEGKQEKWDGGAVSLRVRWIEPQETMEGNAITAPIKYELAVQERDGANVQPFPFYVSPSQARSNSGERTTPVTLSNDFLTDVSGETGQAQSKQFILGLKYNGEIIGIKLRAQVVGSNVWSEWESSELKRYENPILSLTPTKPEILSVEVMES